MKNALLIAAITVLTLGALLVPRRAWALPTKANPYAADIMAAERTNGLPNNLLGRLLFQESRFRDDIINGETQSSAGAVGIAQIIPRFHPGIDPTNPVDSIYYAAGYLSQQKARFGTWELALSAYNFGPTATESALRNHGTKWLDHVPQETQNYVRQIIADVPGALA